MFTLSPLHRRLFPLYIAAFFQGFVIWYSTEKLFMRSIGFDDALIGVMIAVYSAVMLLAETPSGILADRWSRKGVLMLGSVALALSALTGGLSYSVGMFLVSASLWGVFYAMYSGTYDSIVYDVLQEDGHSTDLFERVYGRVRIVDSVALVLGSLAGGVAAALFEPRVTYFLTIPPALASIVALWRFREPMLHRAKQAVPITRHIRDTFGAVLMKPRLVPILVVLILAAVVQVTSFEFDQLWLLALDAPTAAYGPANAVLLGAIGVAGAIAVYSRHRLVLMGLLAAMVGASAALTVLHSLWPVVVAQFTVVAALIALGIRSMRSLHDGLSSNVRAGAASAVSTLGRFIIIPLGLVFGWVSRETSIFQAAWILFGLVVVVAVVALYEDGLSRPSIG